MDGQVTRPSERERASQTPYNLFTWAADDHAATTIVCVAERISVATALPAVSECVQEARELLTTGHSPVATAPLFAAGFDGGDFRQISWKIVRREILNVHLG